MNSFVLRSGKLAFLKGQQNKDGSFVSKTGQSLDFARTRASDTIFLTSLILSSLTSIPESLKLKKIKQKALVFLLSQKSEDWSFNYWKKGSDAAKILPYPDDLDDTFCALSAIFQTDPKALDAQALAKIVTLLTAVEEKEGGPYYTWIVPPTADKTWRDVPLLQPLE